MHIHIATLGNYPQPVLKAVNAIDGVDKVYLLYSGDKYEAQADSVTNTLQNLMIEVHKRPINGFDFNEIVSTIYDIYVKEFSKNIKFSINITGGTNLMAAAACSCAFFVGARIFYVEWEPGKSMKEQLTIIPTPKTPNVQGLGVESKRILKDILDKTQTDKGSITVSELTTYIATKNKKPEDRANLWHHLRKLESEELITVTKGYCYMVPVTKHGVTTMIPKTDKRQSVVSLTQQGSLIARWAGIE